jgi:hypothetical protein
MLKVTVDGEKFTKWASELSERGIRNAIRRGIDKSATAARRTAIEVISQDIGVPKARIRDAVSKVRRTTQTRLPIKGIFAEKPSTALGQPGAAAQVAWTREANKQLAERLPAEIQRQLLAEGIPYSAPADTGD